MKRLAVCCDGTWQELESPYPTNVVKTAQAILPTDSNGIPQVVYYDEGIGTHGGVHRFGGGAFGWGLDKNIQDAYRFLSLNYEEGDEIYLFGFSRGAYTVRSLAGLIHASGLPKRENIRWIAEAYALYRDREIRPDSTEAAEFREKYGAAAPITLLACWDTVGALGVPDQIPFLPIDDWINEKYLFHDTSLNPDIANALHAVSIDEQRKPYALTPMTRSKRNQDQQLRQVWFPGDHSAVGGGSAVRRGLADGALRWVLQSIGEWGLGLETDERRVNLGVQPDPLGRFDNQLKGLYSLTGASARQLTRDFEELHESVLARWSGDPKYRPKHLKKVHGAALDAHRAAVSGASGTSSAAGKKKKKNK